MRNHVQSAIFPAGKNNSSRVFGLLLIAAFLAGCKSVPYEQGQAVASSFQVAAVRIQEESHALDVALIALSNLQTNHSADLRPAFQQYNGAVNRLFGSVQNAEDAANAMQKRSAAHFENWDKQMSQLNYQVVRDSSRARERSVQNDIAQVLQHYRDTREVILPLLAYLTDIQKALAADLTAGGLEALRPIIGNADQNGHKVQVALASLRTEFESSGSNLSAANVDNRNADGTSVHAEAQAQ